VKTFIATAVAGLSLMAAGSASAFNPDNLSLTSNCFYDGSWKIVTHNVDPTPVWWVTVTPVLLPGTLTGDQEVRVTIGVTIDRTPSFEFPKVVHLDGYCTVERSVGVVDPAPPAATPAPPTPPEPAPVGAPPVAYLQPEDVTVIPLPRTVTTTRSGLVRRARLSCARSIRLTDLRRCPGLHTR
jgi:hypothetical protein